MKEFEVAQRETVLVAKNFESYQADRELIERINREFGFRFKPLSASSAWLFTRRRMTRRKYPLLGEISITGRDESGYSIFASGIRVARAVLAGEELIVSLEPPSTLTEEELQEAEQIVRDTKAVYEKLLTKITTEKISEITSRIFASFGATPLRPKRGDFYLLRDTERLRRFIEMVEEANENRELNPHSFIITKIDRSTIDVLRSSLSEKVVQLEERVDRLSQQAPATSIRGVIGDAKDLLVGLQELGSYLLSDSEVSALARRLRSVISKAERKLEAQKRKGVYNRRVL
jgi:hypothetical protein